MHLSAIDELQDGLKLTEAELVAVLRREITLRGPLLIKMGGEPYRFWLQDCAISYQRDIKSTLPPFRFAEVRGP